MRPTAPTISPASAGFVLRDGRLSDISALLVVEAACFDADRLSRRSFHHMLTRGKGRLLVAEDPSGTLPGLLGYALVLFHEGTSLARLYSLAVMPQGRGRGLGEALVRACEITAADHACVSMRLEVRRDNAGAIALYERLGYRRFKVVPDYYEDHMEALRYEKRIAHAAPSIDLGVPYYAQTTDFTCGPACLLMAMKALGGATPLEPRQELQVWREATTIFMASGHGGCGPFGLSLAAWRRGFRVEAWISEQGPLFANTVRDPEKKKVIELVHHDFAEQVAETDIVVHTEALTAADIAAAVEAGGVPLVLISQWRMYGEKAPHWVVVSGADERFFYANDPDVDEDSHKTSTDCTDVPFPRRDFERMARYGRNRLRAAVILYRR